MENQMNSVERLFNFARDRPIEGSEELDAAEESDESDAQWPRDATIEFKDVCMRYHPGLPLALDHVNLSIRSGTSVAIVGRTGAGKSSIVQALLRLVELESGSIEIDDRDISTLSLQKLRNGVVCIPQVREGSTFLFFRSSN